MIHRRLLSGFLVSVVVLSASGCVTNNFRTPPPAFSGQAPMRAVYVYSFLDLRENELGPKFLAEVQRQLAAALKGKGASSAQLSFNDSPLRAEYLLKEEPVSGSRTRQASTRVPVGEVIATNLQAEGTFGAPYRLIVFPVSLTALSTGHRFDVRWDIYDTRTNARVWSATSETLHQNWISHDENPAERAKILVEGIILQMGKAGVFGAERA
jgi:hypothetical protein